MAAAFLLALYARLSAVSRERARAGARRHGRARCGLPAPRPRRGRDRDRRGARDAARRVSGDAGVHRDAAHSGLPRGRSRLLTHVVDQGALDGCGACRCSSGSGSRACSWSPCPPDSTPRRRFSSTRSPSSWSRRAWCAASRSGATARGRQALARAAAALALAIAFVLWLGAPYTHAILWFRAAATSFDDPQGALMFLPAFQFGLFLALWVAAFVPSGWTRFLCGASLLAAIQIAVAGGVQLLAVHAGIAPMVRDIRAWALRRPGSHHCRGGERCVATPLKRWPRRRRPCSSRWSIAAPVLRAPSERIFGAEIVGRHHDPFTVMQQFARPIRPRRVFPAGDRPHRRRDRPRRGRGRRLQLARASELSPVGGGRVSARAAPRAAAARRARRRTALRLFPVSPRPRGLPPAHRADAVAAAVPAGAVALHGRGDVARGGVPDGRDGRGHAVELLRRPDRGGHHADRDRRLLVRARAVGAARAPSSRRHRRRRSPSWCSPA